MRAICRQTEIAVRSTNPKSRFQSLNSSSISISSVTSGRLFNFTVFRFPQAQNGNKERHLSGVIFYVFRGIWVTQVSIWVYQIQKMYIEDLCISVNANFTSKKKVGHKCWATVNNIHTEVFRVFAVMSLLF